MDNDPLTLSKYQDTQTKILFTSNFEKKFRYVVPYTISKKIN